jgi:hypothetical protein
MSKPVSFLASFPPIQSAIKITGNGDGMRIQLDIPESEMGEAAKLILYRQCIVRVTIQPEDYQVVKENTVTGRIKAKRRE